jgi:hypothetical protein
MTTERQVRANRRNSQRSTGPRTGAGKAIVRLNAVKHGLRAAAVVVPGFESPAAWEAFRAGVVDSLQPAGALAEALAERAAGLLWRLQRAERAEALSVAADQAQLEVPGRPRTGEDALHEDDEDRMTDAELLAERERSVANARAKLARYEPAGRLAARLKGLPDEAPIDPAEALPFLAACAEQAQAADAEEGVPEPEDEGALRKAAGVADGASAAFTAGALRRAASLFAAAVTRKRSADWLVKEVAEAADEWVEDSRTTIEMDGPEADALRRRVELRAAIARARRAGVNAAEAAHVARYEGHLQRQLKLTLVELDRLGQRAKGTAPPAAG